MDEKSDLNPSGLVFVGPEPQTGPTIEGALTVTGDLNWSIKPDHDLNFRIKPDHDLNFRIK